MSNRDLKAFEDNMPLEQRLVVRYALRTITRATRCEFQEAAMMADAARIHCAIADVDAEDGRQTTQALWRLVSRMCEDFPGG